MTSERAKRGGGKEFALSGASQAPYLVNASVSYTFSQGAGWFGPLAPPTAQAPKEVAGRKMDYPWGYNQIQTPRAYEPVGFSTMRNMADSYDLLRLIIETRKDQIARMKWNIVPRDPSKQIKGRIKAKVEEIEAFFLRPDKENFWVDWLRVLLEDLLVIDAPCLYKRKTRGGKLYALEPMDGSTIKCVIDDWGRTPEGKNETAYQQVFHGLPAVNYTKDEVIYKPRNRRSQKIYGFSPVEQILMTISIALKRQVYQLNFFTEGNIPEALIGVPETWTPDQIASFQDWFDGVLQGNLAERRRARFVPNAVGKSYIPTKETELFGRAEEWIARVICFAFSIAPTPFINQVNRATAESSSESAELEGLNPTLLWIKSIIDGVILDDFGYDDVVFQWNIDEEVDPIKRASMLDTYVGAGMMTINEARVTLGLDPAAEGIFNDLMYKSSMGYVQIKNGYIPTTAQTSSAAGATGAQGKNQPGAGDNAAQQGHVDDPAPTQPTAQSNPGDAATSASGHGTAPAKKVAEGEERLGKLQEAVAMKAAAALGLVDPTRKSLNKYRAGMKKLFKAQLRDVGSSVADQVKTEVDKLPVSKANDDVVDALVAGITIDFAEILQDIVDQLDPAYMDAAEGGFSVVMSEDMPDDMFNQVHPDAVAWAEEHAAELVGKAADGTSLLDETTRSMIRATIADGLAAAKTSEEIADDLRASYAFSEERATLIALTEVANANGMGALAGFKASGVEMGKSWLNLESSCAVCAANHAQGVIDLDKPFVSGDMAPTAHPHCHCVLVPEVKQAS